jgi:hypothetical protein
MLGRMSASLPFLKKKGLELLVAKYDTSAAAAERIPVGLTSYYEKDQPEIFKTRTADVREAAAVLADIYSRNVFPEFKVDWGTYPNNLGHETSPGCFRCHDGNHATAKGEKLTNNCFDCHYPAAVEDSDPKVLEQLGVDRMLRDLQKKKKN